MMAGEIMKFCLRSSVHSSGGGGTRTEVKPGEREVVTTGEGVERCTETEDRETDEAEAGDEG